MRDVVLIKIQNKTKWVSLPSKDDFVNWALDKYLDEYITGQADGESRVEGYTNE